MTYDQDQTANSKPRTETRVLLEGDELRRRIARRARANRPPRSGPPQRPPRSGAAPHPLHSAAVNGQRAPRVWVTRPILQSRGWTDTSIKKFLPKPEGYQENPYPDGWSRPMPLWRPETIAEAEAAPEWQDWLQQSLKRRKTTLESLAAATTNAYSLQRARSVQAEISAYHRIRGSSVGER